MLPNQALRDTGKLPTLQAPSSSPFVEHQIKQFRAQCLVYLAFRNNLVPKKLHFDIAVGNISPKEDLSNKEHIEEKVNEQSTGPGSSRSGLASKSNKGKQLDRMADKNSREMEEVDDANKKLSELVIMPKSVKE